MLSSSPANIFVSSPSRNRRSENIAEHLRNLITTGQLKPGTRMPTENELCRHFQVSRTTLREATQMLRTSGLLDVTPGRGTFVRLPDVTPLLANLALAARTSPYHAMGTHFSPVSEACNLIPHLLVPLFPGICSRPESMKHALLRHIIQPKLSAAENAQLEDTWFTTLFELAQQNLGSIIVQFLLTVIAAQREISFGNADTILRQRQLQLRCSNALIEGDADVAVRVIQQYFSLLPAASVTAVPAPARGLSPALATASM
jgi:hypothetical protein